MTGNWNTWAMLRSAGASRVTSRPVVPAAALSKGTGYEAGVRLRLDINQLPKPFQVNALASREWTLSSDWYRWTYIP